MKTTLVLSGSVGFVTALTACAMLFSAAPASPARSEPHSPPAGNPDMSGGAANFYKSDKVTVQKVAFKNQYQMTVAGNLFLPKDMNQTAKHAAVVVGHPIGAVKEQSANLYATKMAEKGFITLSLDLSFWGESEGEPRNAVSPDIYAEDFSAAVDFLGTRPFVDRERIGAIGVCGSGSFVISAAKIDPRIKAVATVSMYDMGAAHRHGLKKSLTLEQRKKIIADAAEQRYAEFAGGETKYTGGTDHALTEDTHPIQREFYDFYRTPRGEFTPQGASPATTTHPTLTSNVKFMNFYPFNDIETISPRPMLFITGEAAHSREFSEDAFRLAGEPKELIVVPGAGHVDLYDRVNLIPFDKLSDFFRANLKQLSPVGAQMPDPQKTQIRMDVDGMEVTASLDNSAASREFAAMLPLALTLTDYARIERIADLPRKLTVGKGEDAGGSAAVKAGDLAYYAPWGNLAIFAEAGDAKYVGGLVRLGTVETGLPALQRPGPLKVTIERIEE